MKRLLIRADDLGFSEGVNLGIVKSAIDGLIRSVGIMTNMPEAENGVELLKGMDICFGQHTNICAGRPLCDPAEVKSLVDENGFFRTSKEYRQAFREGKDFVELDDVVREIKAQYHRFKELTGKEPEYFEAHAIASNNLFEGLKIVAEEYGLPLLPFSFEPTQFKSSIVRSYCGSMEAGYEPSSYFRQVIDDAKEDVVNVIVCHPGYLDGYILKHSSLTLPRVWEVDALCDPSLLNYIQDRDVQLVTYADL